MNSTERKMTKRVEELNSDGVQELLRSCSMQEFVDFARDRDLDGRKLMNVTEGIVKLWRPKVNANKLILFIQDLKCKPEKYENFNIKEGSEQSKIEIESNPIKEITVIETTENETMVEVTIEQETKMSVECQYQTVNKIKENSLVLNNEEQYQTVKKTKDSSLTLSNIEDIIKKIVPAKSFLYRNQDKKTEVTSYLPMDAGTPKKRKNFSLSGYDYPIFDMKRFSKPEGDRGYYPMKRNSRFFIQKTKAPESRTKYKSISTPEELRYPEDHFYEDLCYNDIDKKDSTSNAQAKPYKVKIQELFQSFKMPFFRKTEEVFEEVKKEEVQETRLVVDEKEPMYENSDSMANMYDSVHVHNLDEGGKESNKTKLHVEEYLEPVQLNKEYCDVSYKHRDDSLLGYIMSMLETRFGYRRETSDAQNEDSEQDSPSDTKWTTDPHHMADRPLPVPVENEPYYMDIDRHEAENLLKGQPDGTFVLRPSSQASHAYTLSVACAACVHNVGVRRRPDARLALGFARKGERSFADVTSLLRHHRKRRLLLVAQGAVLGATTLTDSPQYYQTPRSIPLTVI